MIRHDVTQWPLVLSVMHGPVTEDEQKSFFAEWDRWLDRGTPFATLRIFCDPVSLQRPAGGAKDAKTWLQANAVRIRSSVQAIATVVPASCFDEASRMDAEKLFGVPARTFADVMSAIAWIRDCARVQNNFEVDASYIERLIAEP